MSQKGVNTGCRAASIKKQIIFFHLTFLKIVAYCIGVVISRDRYKLVSQDVHTAGVCHK